jgi:hypothetical protein
MAKCFDTRSGDEASLKDRDRISQFWSVLRKSLHSSSRVCGTEAIWGCENGMQ